MGPDGRKPLLEASLPTTTPEATLGTRAGIVGAFELATRAAGRG